MGNIEAGTSSEDWFNQTFTWGFQGRPGVIPCDTSYARRLLVRPRHETEVTPSTSRV